MPNNPVYMHAQLSSGARRLILVYARPCVRVRADMQVRLPCNRALELKHVYLKINSLFAHATYSETCLKRSCPQMAEIAFQD